MESGWRVNRRIKVEGEERMEGVRRDGGGKEEEG